MPEKTPTARTPKTPFVSHADTPELREYQRLASKYPPMKHSEMVACAREFQRGRDMQVALEERELVMSVVGDDFTDDALTAAKEEIDSLYAARISWLSGKVKAPVLLAKFAGSDDASALYDRRDENVLSSPAYAGKSVTMAQMYPPCAEMTREEFVESVDKVRTACTVALEDYIPKDIPKDVVDCWRRRHAMFDTHYLTTVKSLDMSPSQLRRANTKVSMGQDALDAMVNHNLQLAMSRVSRILKSNPRAKTIGISDLIGAANVGLILGARQFDPEMGRKFSTYASFHIDAQLFEVVSSIDEPGGIKGMTLHELKQFRTIKSMQSSFEKIYDRQPTMQELQSLTGISRVIIEKRLGTPQISCESLNAPVKQGDEESVMLSELLSSETTIESEMEQSDMLEAARVLRECIAELPHIHRAVVEGKTGISLSGDVASPKSAKKIAAECKISAHDVPIRYNEAMDMLRKKLEEKGYSSDLIPLTR